MSDADYLALGDWNANCSMCGRKRKASELVRNWQGQWRCPEHNESRHPQDYVRGVPENQTPPFTQVAGQLFAFVTLDAEDGGTLEIPDDFLLTEAGDPILI